MDADTPHNITLPACPIYIIRDAAIAGIHNTEAKKGNAAQS